MTISFFHIRRAVSMGLVAAAFFVIGTPHTQAATASCKFSQNLELLKSLQQKPQGDYAESIRAELSVRKNILKNILDCSTKEAQDLQANVQAVRLDDKDAQALQDKLLASLAEALKYYKTEGAAIDDAGVRATQNIARDVAEWRTSHYGPLARTCLNFILWGRNQHLITTAHNRLDQIAATIKTLSIVQNDDLQSQLTIAQNNFKDTVDANAAARAMLLKDPASSPDDTLDSIKSSLDKLSLTYKAFFDLSALVSKVLPH